MSTQDENRKESFTHRRILAAAAFGFMLGAGYAVATHVEGQTQDSKLAIPAVPAAPQETEYFPSQYVNQAKELEEHIEAF